ncbi:MAG: ankyrin repeat domain-containing protein [Planctomycetes bacterium]|nr:ankyrin repeat domain-containing protein [Planctomycetota bacterium]
MNTPFTRVCLAAVVLAAMVAGLGGCYTKEKQSFFLAVHGGNISEVENMLGRHDDWVDTVNDEGAQPIHVAAMEGKTKVAVMLLERGADIEAKHKNSWRPLCWACERGHAPTAEMLLDRGAEIDARDRWGRTPLYWAATHGHKPVVELLIARKADVNAADENGSTPLHEAVRFGEEACVAMLIRAGADVNAMDKAKQRPLGLATHLKRHEKIRKMLLAAGATQ